MKNKAVTSKILKTIPLFFILMTGIGACLGLYYLIDTIWNGRMVDWFSINYMVTHEVYYPGFDQSVIVTEPVWWKVKRLCLAVLIIVVVAFLVIVMTVSHLRARAAVKKSVTAVSRMIRQYMGGDYEASGIFPKEYAEISVQMAEIKTTMQRHEQVIKDEVARKNDLITYLAHDLKTPLTSVIGYLSFLDETPDMPAAQKAKYVNIALDKAYRLETLINEFFEITRYNLQQMELEKETIDLCYMLVQMMDEFYPLFEAHGNKAELHVDEDMTVYGDSEKLARVFNNILKNAIAYSYRDTVIDIRAEESDGMVRICFSNRGKTIPEQKLNSVFEKFFRLDEARATNTGGAGLGLAIAKEIVTLHGGTITASSENERTTFCVSLPAENG